MFLGHTTATLKTRFRFICCARVESSTADTFKYQGFRVWITFNTPSITPSSGTGWRDNTGTRLPSFPLPAPQAPAPPPSSTLPTPYDPHSLPSPSLLLPCLPLPPHTLTPPLPPPVNGAEAGRTRELHIHPSAPSPSLVVGPTLITLPQTCAPFIKGGAPPWTERSSSSPPPGGDGALALL